MRLHQNHAAMICKTGTFCVNMRDRPHRGETQKKTRGYLALNDYRLRSAKSASTISSMRSLNGRGRDRGFPRPPAQIRAGRITALGSYLEYERRTDPKAKDDRFVRLAAIGRHVESSDPTSSVSSGSVAEAIGTTSESLQCGTGRAR